MGGEDGVHTIILLSAQEDVQAVPGPRACDREPYQGGILSSLPSKKVPGSDVCPPEVKSTSPQSQVNPEALLSSSGKWAHGSKGQALSHLATGSPFSIAAVRPCL